MSLFDFINAMSAIASNSAQKREENHSVEHSSPTVVVTDPSDEGTLDERADRAESVDEADYCRGCIAPVHFAELTRKRAAQNDIRTAVQETDYNHRYRVHCNAHIRRR